MLDFLISNDLLATILAFAIVFIPAVIIHELGHLFAAKAVGITVLEFGIGFPPRIAKLFTWRETEFTLNVLPFGGFVRPLGEDMIRPISVEETKREREKLIASREAGRSSEAEESTPFGNEREELAARGFHETMAVNEAPPWPRIFFMAAGAIANFIFAFVVFVFIGLTGVPKEVGVRVGFALVPENSALADLGFQQGDIIERFNGAYIASADDLFSGLEESIGQPVTVEVRRTVDNTETLIEKEFVPTQDLITLLKSPQTYVLIAGIEQGSPGDTGGLQPNDVITAFNGESLGGAVNPAQSLINKTNAAAGQEVVLTVLRNGETLQIPVVPRENPPPGSGKIGIEISTQFVNPEGTFGYGIARQFNNERQPFVTSVRYGFDRVAAVFSTIAEFPARLIGGDTAPEERRVVSVVGISMFGKDILQDSIVNNRASAMLEYVALISIALGVTNLLPIPALDGGRIVFVVLELIRGKPIPPEREGLVHLVGIIFILSLGIFVMINDLVNPLTDSLLR